LPSTKSLIYPLKILAVSFFAFIDEVKEEVAVLIGVVLAYVTYWSYFPETFLLISLFLFESVYVFVVV